MTTKLLPLDHVVIPGKWYVYLLRSTTSRRTYIGASLDPFRRLRQHNRELVGGARATAGGRPWEVFMLLGPYDTSVTAYRVEWRWKRFRGQERFRYRQWVAELDDNAVDKDKHLHHHKQRRKR